MHFLQIWLFPRETGLAPRYSEADFPPDSKRNQLRLIISPDGREGSLRIEQDAFIYATLMEGDQSLTHTLAPGRRGYVHLIRGTLDVNGQKLEGGDALMLEAEAQIELARGHDAEALVFDLP